jgi:hypothetical protein|tara:strand:+ start:142 stop:1017 length:876 start_codon:yes stop_codon:yes gene_type:complete
MRGRIRRLLREYEVRPGEKVIWDKDGTTTVLDADGAIRLIKWDENNIKDTLESVQEAFENVKGDKEEEIGFIRKTYDKLKKIGLISASVIGLLFAMALYGSNITKEDLSQEFPEEKNVIIKIEPKEIKPIDVKDIEVPIKIQRDNLDKFLKDLAMRESSGKWDTINQLGYIGLYQFGDIALKDIGIDDKVTTTKFKENPNIFPPQMQTQAMIKLLKNNKHYTRRVYNKIGETYNGIEVTESGILAASHLVGAKAVRRYLKSKGRINETDGNGVSVKDYMEKFSGYDLSELG